MKLVRRHYFFNFLALLLVCGCTQRSSINFITRGISTDNPTPLACDPAVTGAYGGGTGTVADPYAICSLAQWNFLGTDSASWSKNFKLFSDIDFTSTTFATFHPIGTVGLPFTGQLDGNNFKLMNLSVTSGANDIALFVQTDNNVTIKNLILKNIFFNSTRRASGLISNHGNGGTLQLSSISLDHVHLKMAGAYSKNGGLVGYALGPLQVNNVIVDTLLFDDPSASTDFNGSVVGYSSSGVTVTNMSGNGVSYSAGFSIYRSGGLAGQIEGAATFSDINLTNVNISGGQMAGIVWEVNDAITINRVHLKGSVAGTTLSAGLIGQINPTVPPSTTTINEASFDGDLIASSAGGLVGTSFGSNVTISKSYYKGNMNSIWSGTGAGLVKNAQGATTNLIITDSYAIANLTNSHATNFLVAGITGGSSNNITISRAYFTGSLSGSAPRACVGKSAGTVSYATTDVYFNSTLCTVGADVSGGTIPGSTGLSTGAFQSATPFTNWSPTVWTFAAGQNPKLSWEP